MTSPSSGPKGLRPRVGFSPTRPLQLAGMRIDPPPSLACATGTMPLATAAPDPPDEPPVECAGFQGLQAGPYSLLSVVATTPNSGTLVLPIGISPPARKRCTNVAVKGIGTGGEMRDPLRVGHPARSPNMSLSRKGTPRNGPSGSGAFARVRAPS